MFCPAFVLHVLEEWPRFTGWARLHASARSRSAITVCYATGIAVSLLSALIVSQFPNRHVVFIFFAFVFTPAVLFNTLFHICASVLTRSYCPGAITAVAIYLPLFAMLTALAYREGLRDMGALIATLVLAGVFHAGEVGHNVFKAW